MPERVCSVVAERCTSGGARNDGHDVQVPLAGCDAAKNDRGFAGHHGDDGIKERDSHDDKVKPLRCGNLFQPVEQITQERQHAPARYPRQGRLDIR